MQTDACPCQRYRVLVRTIVLLVCRFFEFLQEVLGGLGGRMEEICVPFNQHQS